MGDLVRVNFGRRPAAVIDELTVAIVSLDRELAVLEETIAHAAYWAERSRGKERRRRFRECAELSRQILVLERARLRLAGPELALLRGGKS
jgi:hypothetical protein